MLHFPNAFYARSIIRDPGAECVVDEQVGICGQNLPADLLVESGQQGQGDDDDDGPGPETRTETESETLTRMLQVTVTRDGDDLRIDRSSVS